MKFVATFALLAVLYTPFAHADEIADKQKVADHLQTISVTIVSKNRMGGGEGSGVIKTRKMPDGSACDYVWTAAHVVDNLRKTRSIIDGKSGTPKTVVEFDDAMIVKGLTEEGRNVGKIEMFAQVIRYSAEEDLALLRVRKKNFGLESVTFYLDETIPPIGTDLLHVGSLLGQMGSNSMTQGIMSQHGRLLDNKVFDQTTVNAFPGSSGGGVYLKDGRMMGMLVRGAGETFNLIVPVRRMRTWAKQASVEWAIDDNVPMPTDEQLKKLPIEDNGVEFSYSVKAADAAKPPADLPPPPANPNGFKLIKLGNGPNYLGDLEEKFPTWFYWQPAKP